MTSSLFTISPSFFNHLAITASVIDSLAKALLHLSYSFLKSLKSELINSSCSITCLLNRPVAVEAELFLPE